MENVIENKHEEKLKKIAVLGPHDRMNYGDFLFPIVIDYCFSKYLNSHVSLSKYSLRNSDFSDIGAYPSSCFKMLKKNVNKGEINYVIVAGGESLGASWDVLYYYIDPWIENLRQSIRRFNHILFRFIDPVLARLPKYILGGNVDYPYAFSSMDFRNKNLQVFYNSVGGASKANNKLVDTIAKGTITNVRDIKSFNFLKNCGVGVNLAPDSAVMLSQIYPKETLDKIYDDRYIFFQLSNYYLTDKIQIIADQLTHIADENQCKIVLCSIGTAFGHEDHIVLEKIHKLLPDISFLFAHPSIQDIVSLIAHANLYIGSSLHGFITAMNYGTPYITLEGEGSKQAVCMKTWSIEELQNSYLKDVFELADRSKILLTSNVNEKIIAKNMQHQDLYSLAINKIIEEILKERE